MFSSFSLFGDCLMIYREKLSYQKCGEVCTAKDPSEQANKIEQNVFLRSVSKKTMPLSRQVIQTVLELHEKLQNNPPN